MNFLTQIKNIYLTSLNHYIKLHIKKQKVYEFWVNLNKKILFSITESSKLTQTNLFGILSLNFWIKNVLTWLNQHTYIKSHQQNQSLWMVLLRVFLVFFLLTLNSMLHFSHFSVIVCENLQSISVWKVFVRQKNVVNCKKCPLI